MESCFKIAGCNQPTFKGKVSDRWIGHQYRMMSYLHQLLLNGKPKI